MIIEIQYKQPQEDDLLSELVEVIKIKNYKDKVIYTSKQAGIGIETTVYEKDADVILLHNEMKLWQENQQHTAVCTVAQILL